MKKYILSLTLILLYCAVYADNRAEKWNIAKATHFIISYKHAPEDFIDKLIDNAEQYYDEITDELGFRRYDFWLWDDRAKIYIYDNSVDYQLATGQPAWSGGCAYIKGKIIHTFPYAQSFFETILPHEMGHIIFREFVGFDNPALPLWLEEGVACYQQKLKYSTANAAIRQALSEDKFMPLNKLSGFNPQSADGEAVQIFYAESFSVIDFLIRDFGRDSFVLFCRSLRDKKDLERAIAANYNFKNIDALNEAWVKYLRDEE